MRALTTPVDHHAFLQDERLAFADARVQAEKEAKRRRMISKGQEMVRAITNVWMDAKYPGMREVRPDELCQGQSAASHPTSFVSLMSRVLQFSRKVMRSTKS